jgi:hypothetical protein
MNRASGERILGLLVVAATIGSCACGGGTSGVPGDANDPAPESQPGDAVDAGQEVPAEAPDPVADEAAEPATEAADPAPDEASGVDVATETTDLVADEAADPAADPAAEEAAAPDVATDTDCGTCAPLHGKCGVDGLECDPVQHVCVLVSDGVAHGYCLWHCNPAAPDCPGDAECIDLGGGDGACLPAGTADVDSPCGQAPDAAALDASAYCEAGLLCVIFSSGAFQGVCLPIVPACTAGACAAGRLCLGLSGGKGACAFDCKATACPAGTECVSIASGDKICGPEPTYGPVAFGGLCSTPASELGCQEGLTCLVAQAEAQGFCSPDCTASGTCPPYVNGAGKSIPATCMEVSSTQKFCLFPCGGIGQTCPDGLSCSGSGICLAP